MADLRYDLSHWARNNEWSSSASLQTENEFRNPIDTPAWQFDESRLVEVYVVSLRRTRSTAPRSHDLQPWEARPIGVWFDWLSLCGNLPRACVGKWSASKLCVSEKTDRFSYELYEMCGESSNLGGIQSGNRGSSCSLLPLCFIEGRFTPLSLSPSCSPLWMLPLNWILPTVFVFSLLTLLANCYKRYHTKR